MAQDPQYLAAMERVFWVACILFLASALVAFLIQWLTQRELQAWLSKFLGRPAPRFVQTMVGFRFPRWLAWAWLLLFEAQAVWEIYRGTFAIQAPPYVALQYGEAAMWWEVVALCVFIVPALYLCAWGVVWAARTFLELMGALLPVIFSRDRERRAIPPGVFTDDFHWLMRRLRFAILAWGFVGLFGTSTYLFVRDTFTENQRLAWIGIVVALLLLLHVVPMLGAAYILARTVRPTRESLLRRLGEVRRAEAHALDRKQYTKAGRLNEQHAAVAGSLALLPPAGVLGIVMHHWWKTLGLALPPLLALASPAISSFVERFFAGL